MRVARPTFGVLAAVAITYASAQMTYPDCYIQNTAWTSGTHYEGVPQPVIAPGDASMPTSVSGTAEAELVSGTQVRLTAGFHAGDLTGVGRFRARIDQSFGSPDDIVVITPDPTTHLVDEILHVEKWEKLEIGFRLPQEYEEAIENFFGNYYPDAPTNYAANPSNTDDAHDLNPYADDSLVMYMTLTDPVGAQRMKWGFYMKEGAWASNDPLAQLAAADPATNALVPYTARFRFAPDKEGLWQFNLSLRAPHTTTLASVPLQPLQYMGYNFICDPPLPDNNGYLQVSPNNRRTLQFQGDKDTPGDETPFFGLGTNMADVRHNTGFAGAWDQFHQCDFNAMKQTMQQLHEVGGNFLRMYLMRYIFAPEWVNLGVYDAFRPPGTCDGDTPPNLNGNCQHQCWAFDRVLDHARENDVYIQLCIDPYPPIIAYEDILWAGHAYSLSYLEPNRDQATGRFDMKEFFYTPHPDTGVPMLDEGVFYYWKRKYKYIMSRWGYSVNLPIIEPFNEIDQMLTYRYANLTQTAGKCNENRLVWPEDPDLPETLDSWLTDITGYVRGDVDLNNPVASPLGENKLFLASYTSGVDAIDFDTQIPNTPPTTDHFLPFTNVNVDLIDVHKGFFPHLQGPGNETQPGTVDWRMHEGFKHATDFWNTFPEPNAGLEERKPFNQGEFNHYTSFEIPNPLGGDPLWKNDIEKIFHNYDISFHNELWSSAFSGKFAAGTTWHWERVFWWPDALVPPPFDDLNLFFHPTAGMQFSNAQGDVNELYLGGTTYVPVTNQTLHHHFRPLADFLSRPSVQDLGILDGNYTTEAVFDNTELSPNPIECYYLTNPEHNTAIGWIHNRNASVAKSFYTRSGVGNENFLGCMAPTQQYVDLPGFESGQDYYIYWLPTRHDVSPTDLPEDQIDDTGDGTVHLDLTSNPLGGVLNNYLDTLHADYAFIISPEPIVKSLPHVEEPVPTQPSWDFTLHPNPARDELFIRLPDESPKEIALYDPAGRRLSSWGSVAAAVHRLSVAGLAKGVYWIRVSDDANVRSKKLMVH